MLFISSIIFFVSFSFTWFFPYFIAINIKTANIIPIYATNVKYGEDVKNLSIEEKKCFSLIIGNEGNGISLEIKNLVDKNIYIPMNKKTESLNASIAASIIMYEMSKVDYE